MLLEIGYIFWFLWFALEFLDEGFGFQEFTLSLMLIALMNIKRQTLKGD